jgi:vacuolar-type H+-ATPase subunit E/Vma4
VTVAADVREGNATMRAALAPVAAALRAHAERDAAALLAAADADVRDTEAAARARAAATIAQARADGEAAAERAARVALASARRDARGDVLAARRRALEMVRAGALAELARRWTTPAGDALVERLTAAARARLGPDAVVRPIDGPGVGAEAGGRHLDVTCASLLERALAEFGARIDELWT